MSHHPNEIQESLHSATAAITLACLFLEMLCYVLGRLHSSCVQHTGELINETLVNDDLSFFLNFLFICV